MLTKEQVQDKVDPRTKRTRQLILKAFSELLGEKSFESITVQEIADRATVNRATFYAHFEDKYTLLDQAFAMRFESALRKNLSPECEFSPTNLQLLIQTVCEFLADLHTDCARAGRTQFDPLIEQQVKLRLYQFLLRWLKPMGNGTNSRSDNEMRATVTSSAIYAASSWWSQGERKESAAEFARRALPMIMAALEPSSALSLKKPRAER